MLIDNHLYQGNTLNLDPSKITFRRCLDINDRALRNVTVSKDTEFERNEKFDISVASEIMAIFCLATSLEDLKNKLNKIIIGYTYDNNPRYVYYREAESFDVIGKMGVKISKIRTVAMDDSIYTLGLPVYINTSLSDGRSFNRLMIAQDTGGAIRGWIRADIFFGSGDEAYQVAHGQHAKGQMFILMPKEYSYVKPR